MKDFETSRELIKWLLTIAWLLPLLGFAVEIFAGWWSTRTSKLAAYLAVACIGTGFICSVSAFYTWQSASGWALFETDSGADHAKADGTSSGKKHADDADAPVATADEDAPDENASKEHAPDEHASEAHTADEHAADEHAKNEHTADDHASDPGAKDGHAASQSESKPQAFAGKFYDLGTFGGLTISLDYYVDSLTLVMFMMVTLIATCIHVFAMGYMSDELTEDYVDHQVHTSDGGHFHRPGRFYRFFAFMSLFCFSMLGLVLAGNIFQVFVFWELVGICSYLLIGFYVERKSASTAANKAFIMNRVGDFGFLIGLMVIWTWFGSFQFVEMNNQGEVTGGIFQMLRGTDGQLNTSTTDDGVSVVALHTAAGADPVHLPYSLLVVAGLGIFAGCIGKSAQFPLQTWLPDAMEGPTPVSALVHSATMVAAGVYLTGRFYPMFAPEVLLTISYIACITLFVAATIAVVATDIKRVLAYSTISQLGYMMLGLGVFGWTAGLFHLITHAFFKSLMFLASGSVIVGCHHEQEMPRMGGLWRKMPITAFTMLVGVIAISGLAIPGLIAFSGYHSKDAIVATALTFSKHNPLHFLLFFIPLITAGITAFYMFRLWFYTFAGQPRDEHLHDHAHESPLVMVAPLLILSVFAAFCAAGGEHGSLFRLIENSQPHHVEHMHGVTAVTPDINHFGKHEVHENHATAGYLALIAAVAGTFLAYLLYCVGLINPGEIKKQFASVHGFLVDKWCFDELYDTMFMRPVHVVASWCTWIDKHCFDAVLHTSSRLTVRIANWDRKFDERFVDGAVDFVGFVTTSVGTALRVVQTGKLRQYVMFIAVGLMALFVVLFVLMPQ